MAPELKIAVLAMLLASCSGGPKGSLQALCEETYETRQDLIQEVVSDEKGLPDGVIIKVDNLTEQLKEGCNA